MPRFAARIKHDEVVTMVKAVKDCGLTIARVTYNGERIDVIIGESEVPKLDDKRSDGGLLREPQL